MKTEKLLNDNSGNIAYFSSFKDNINSILNTVVAFANSYDGKIVLGVENDTRNVIGINEEIYKAENYIFTQIASECEPFIQTYMSVAEIKGKKIIIIDVPVGFHKPYYIKSEGIINGTYIRKRYSNCPVDELELQSLTKEDNKKENELRILQSKKVKSVVLSNPKKTVSNTNIRYQVFVSSTYEDLIEERMAASQAILEAHCIPAGMELFPASSKPQWEFIKKVIDDSDFYLVISAGRYGSLGTDDDGKKKSYTEMEFDYALKQGKPIIALIHNDIQKLSLERSEKTQTGHRRLLAFHSKLMNGRVVRFWSNTDELKSLISNALHSMKDDIASYNVVGWIKADESKAGDNDKILYESILHYKEKADSLEEKYLEYKSTYDKWYNETRRLEYLIYRAYLDPSVLQSDEVRIIVEDIEYTETMQEAMRRMYENDG